LGATFIFKISLYGLISRPQVSVGETFEGAAAWRLAFIEFLAYMYWLVLSRDKMSGFPKMGQREAQGGSAIWNYSAAFIS
jgi:hypothetical protein